jgi:outer membrane protein assembly factor BamA
VAVTRRLPALAAALVAAALAGPARPALAGPAPSLFGRRLAGVTLEGTGQLLDANGRAKPVGGRELLSYLRLREGQPLTRTALRLGLTLFYQQNKDVLARVSVEGREADGGRVRLVLVAEPRRRVSQVTIRGEAGLDQNALQRAAELPPGTEFSPERVDKAATAMGLAYFRRGFRDAQIQWSARADGDDLAVAFQVSEGRPSTLVKVEFTGELGLDERELLTALDLEKNGQLSLDAVEAGVASLRARFRQRGFYRARIGPPRIQAADGRGVLQLALEAGPRFRLQVRGNRRFPHALLLDQLRYSGEEALDPAMQRELAERLRAFYELAGYPTVKVLARETERPPPTDPALPSVNERLVSFAIDEGPRAQVVAREFPGLTVFTQEEFEQRIDVALADAMPEVLQGERTQTMREVARVSGHGGAPTLESPRPLPSEVYAGGTYRAALELLTDLYKSRGYLDARVGPAELVLCSAAPDRARPPAAGGPAGNVAWQRRCEPGTALVRVPVVEGRQTTVRSVELVGAVRLGDEQRDRAITLKRGDPLSFFAVEESRAALAAAYQAEGYLFADVVDEVEVDDLAATASVKLDVHEGPRVRASRVVLQGLNPRTDRQLVLDALVLAPGDVVTPQARQLCIRNLLSLGLFTSATVKLGETPEEERQEEPEKPLVVVLREKPTVALQATGGFSAVDGPRIAAQATFNNVAGRNLTGILSAKVNNPYFPRLAEELRLCPTCPVPVDTIERRFYASLLVPAFREGGADGVLLRFDAVHENLLRPAYQLTKYALLSSADGLRLGFGAGEGGLTLLLQGELESSEFTRRRQASLALSAADRAAALLPEGTLLMASLRPTLTLDLRNDRLNPTDGFIGSVALDGAKSFGGVKRDTGEPLEVLLLRVLASGTLYRPLPVWPGRRVVLVLAGRFGGILRADGTEVVGTKRFFLGGTQTLRGFNEDNVYPQDVRENLHDAHDRCQALPSGVGCIAQIRALQANVVAPSSGGQLLVTGRAELRFALGEATDLGLFLDAGNLWSDPRKVDLTRLRSGAGVGVRFALPVGPAAIDLAANTSPDPLFAEPLFRLHLSVGLY